jgi:glucose/arabinose dehydrogenase
MLRSRLAAAAALLLGLTGSACTRTPVPADAAPAAPPGSPAIEKVAAGLDRPSFLTHAGDARWFVTLLPGQIVVFRDGKRLPVPFLDIHERVSVGGERGLFAVAFHPRYRENGWFFVNYTNSGGDTEIVRFRVRADDPDRADAASGVVLLVIKQPYANHNGGQLLFGPDGMLYVGMGDGGSGNDPHCNGQRSDTLLGKMLRLDVDAHDDRPPYYGIPADNPFRGAGDAPDEVWATGLRNPWRFSFDRETGDLWIGDVGQVRVEEIDFLAAGKPAGANFGWNVKEGSECFSRECSRVSCRSDAFTDPVLEYPHKNGDCSVTGGFVYRGRRHPALRGWYFYADYCSGRVWRARSENGRFVNELLPFSASTVSSFGEDHAGELYLMTLGGDLFRITG